MYGHLRVALSDLGWTPDDFWAAQAYEVQLALDGTRDFIGQRDARLASWIIGGARAAIYSENFSAPDIDDLYDPDPMTKEDADKQREDLSSTLPPTLE